MDFLILLPHGVRVVLEVDGAFRNLIDRNQGWI